MGKIKLTRGSLFFVSFALILIAALVWTIYTVIKSNVSADILAVEICDNGVDDNRDGKIDGCWDPGTSYAVTGKTYYVSPTGNDSATGSQAAPFKTITKAAQLVVAGDGIFINSGVYPEAVEMVNSGTATNPIIIKGIGATKPVIRCDLDCGIAHLKPRSNTIIDNIKFDGIQAIKNGNQEGGGYGVWVDGDSNVMVTNSEFTQLGRGIFGENGNRLIVRNSKLWNNTHSATIGRDSGSDSEPWDLFPSTLFENVEFADSVYDYNTDGISIEGANGWHVIRNCRSHGFSDAGYDIKARVIIENSIAYDNNEIGFKIWRNGTLRNNIAYNNRTSNYTFGGLDPDWKLINSVSYNGLVSFEKRELTSPLITNNTIKVSHNIFANTRFNDEIGGALISGENNIYFNSGILAPPSSTSKIADPKFKNLAGFDFTLLSGSPAIDGGSAILQSFMTQKDILGNPRKSGAAVDIGPFEVQSTSVSPTATSTVQIQTPTPEPSPSPSAVISSVVQTPTPVVTSTPISTADNKAPVISADTYRSVQSGNTLIFTVNARDPEGERVTLRADTLPTGAKFSSTGEFSWRPTTLQYGSYSTLIKATDARGLSSTKQIYIKVTKKVSLLETRWLNVDNKAGEPRVEFQVCRRSTYSSKFREVITFSDGTPYQEISEDERSACSNLYSHNYLAGEHQMTLYLCQKDASGKLINCFPNRVLNLTK